MKKDIKYLDAMSAYIMAHWAWQATEDYRRSVVFTNEVTYNYYKEWSEDWSVIMADLMLDIEDNAIAADALSKYE